VITTQLHDAHLSLLVERCAEQTARFFARVANDTRYCLELFRRAIVEHDQAAWEAIYGQYRNMVRGWLARHPQIDLTGETAEDLVNVAFDKMWTALNPEKFARFADPSQGSLAYPPGQAGQALAALLRYLQMCAHSTVIDCIRRVRREQMIREYTSASFDGADVEGDRYSPCSPSPEQAVDERLAASDLWQRVRAQLHDEREELILYCSVVLDETPKEIYSHYADRFGDVQDIYNVKRNVLKRLERNLRSAE
jgi:DNA-directed RNA polymerase specialized sigma24 family protein